MALKLDLSLDGLGLQNMSLSVPDSRLPGSPPQPRADQSDRPVPVLRRETTATEAGTDQMTSESQDGWEAETNSSQSVMTFGSRPSTASPLSDLPLTPIPELLHTPTGHSMPINGEPTTYERPSSHTRAYPAERRYLTPKLPSPLDNEPILAQLSQGENDVGIIQNVRSLQ
jgi:hypothetical protein